MTTFGQLVQQTRQQLLGYSMNQEQIAELDSAMTDADTTFTVDGDTVDALSQGLVEIDDELILVKTIDRGSATATVLGGANCRGREGTTAVAHSAQALVTAAPSFPRARIKEAINTTVTGLYPSLVVFASTEISRVSVQYEYELPEDCRDVWYVVGETLGPSRVWAPLPNWRFNPDANTGDFPSGKSLQQLDPVAPGQKIRVVYAKAPTVMTGDADDFEATTGFPDRITDLVLYGTLKRLLPATEAARLQMRSVEASERAALVETGSATKAVGMYASLYQERLMEERDRMFREMPTYATFQGS